MWLGTDARVRQRGGGVVAVQGDVQAAERRRVLLELAEPVAERAGHGDSAASNGDQDQIGRAGMPLDDLTCHATQAARDALRVEQGSHGAAS